MELTHATRHDAQPQKLIEAIYWSFTELPTWLLRRKEGWFPFALVRSLAAHELEGSMSELASIVLDTFFPEKRMSYCMVAH